MGRHRPRRPYCHNMHTRPCPQTAPPLTPPEGYGWLGHPPPHGRQNYHPGDIHTGLPCRGGPQHDQPPYAASTPPTGTSGTRTISPRHGRPDKTPNPTPRCNPKGRNRICLEHPRRIPSPRTRPTNDGPVYGPKRSQMRIGSTPPHSLMAKPPTQGRARRGLLEFE